MSVITILAGGFSASQLDVRKLPGTVIAVNDAAYYAPYDLCVSMDRLWTENRWSWIERQKKPVWLRRATLKNVDVRKTAHVTPYENNHLSTILSDEPGTLNGTHSGFCALNLAYVMRPLELYLVGFDMTLGPKGERHWYPNYYWSQSTGQTRLLEWSDQFDTAARQLRAAGVSVFLVGAESKVKSFKTLDRATFERRAVCAA